MRFTQQRVQELLAYDPDTGIFIWRIDVRAGRNNAFVMARTGDRAGFQNGEGYRALSIDGVRTSEHQVAWLLMTGEWREGDIDHEDSDRANNRWKNLRPATRSQNMQNLRGAHRDSGTGLLGVERKRNRFAARICVDGRRTHLGVFETPEQAHQAYLAAKRQMHERNTL